MARGFRSNRPAPAAPSVVLLGIQPERPLERAAATSAPDYALFFGVQAPAVPAPAPDPGPARVTAFDRENPDKLSGDELRELAHRRGVARSEAARMSEDKLRMQLRYITYRQYGAA